MKMRYLLCLSRTFDLGEVRDIFRIPYGVSLTLVLLGALLVASFAPPSIASAQQSGLVDLCSNGIAVPDPQNDPGLVQDCAALLTAKDILAADPPLNWSADILIYEWEGISFNDYQSDDNVFTRVAALELVGRNLTGSIPPEFGAFANLESLELGANQLAGEIPPQLGRLTNLSFLLLYNNQLTGSIPPELGDLANLRVVELGGNRLTGAIPPDLGNLTNLTVLWLHANQLTGPIPPELANLTSLQVLILGGNPLTGCIPEGLREVPENDLAELGLPFCDAGPPPPTLIDDCVTLLHSDVTITGRWDRDSICLSGSRPDDGDYYARFYQFIMDAAADVTITLTSEHDTYLYLFDGEASGAALHENDDYDYTNSQIQATLQPASYTIEATTYGSGVTGEFTLTVSGLGVDRTIVFSDLNWTSVQVQNRVAQYIIEHGYGYPTEAVSGDTLSNFHGLREGQIQVAMEIWLPNQSIDWESALESGDVVSAGTSLVGDWQSTFVIPEYIADAHPDLRTPQDLKKPKFQQLFATDGSQSKARLVACVIGWACELINTQQIEAYGLTDYIHIVNAASNEEMFDFVYTAFERQEPWLGYMWGTGDPALKLDLVRLEEPPYSQECWNTNKECAFADSLVVIGVHNSLPLRAPEVAEMFRNWDFTIDMYRSIFQYMDATGSGVSDAAIWFLEDNKIWESWVTPEAAEAVNAALAAAREPDPQPPPSTPPVTPPPSGGYTSLVIGELHTCGLRTDGSVVCWGNNEYGQASPPSGDRFTFIVAGRHHTCGIRLDGSAVCWGRNDYGQSTSP